MTRNFKMISFRVRTETLDLLHCLVDTQTGWNFPPATGEDFHPMNRSEMLRLALTTGLDYLAGSHHPPHERVQQCRSSAMKPPTKPPPKESASSVRQRPRR